MQRMLLWGFIVSICACGAFGVFVLLTASFGWWELRVLMTTAVVSAASILSMVAAIAWESRRWKWTALAGMIVPGLALLASLILIWDVRAVNYQRMPELAGVLCTLAVAFPHLSMVGLARLHRGYEWARLATAAAIVLLTGCVCGMILNFMTGDMSIRITAALAILVACGTIAVFVLHRVSRIRRVDAIVTATREIDLTCPRCAKTQRMPTGLAVCACGLRIRIEIEEETCQRCGYSLYNISSANCPECGTAVVQA